MLPIIIDINENQWTKIAENVKDIYVKKLKTDVKYFVSTVLTGESAPENFNTAHELFTEKDFEYIFQTESIDIYIFCRDHADNSVNTGKVKVFEWKRIFAFTGDAVKTTTYADDYITQGKCFNIQKRFAIASGATLKACLDFSSVAQDKILFLLPLNFVSSGGYFKIDTCKISSYTGGTSGNFINANDYFQSNAAQTIFKSGITATKTTDNLREYIIGGGSNPVSSRGGAFGSANAIVIDQSQNKKIYIEMVNTTNASADMTISIVLY